MNVLESLLHVLQPPHSAPHVGEVGLMWTVHAASEASRATTLLMLNHTNDPELKDTMEHYIADVLDPNLRKLTDLMRQEGIPFPSAPDQIPKADETAIPPGAKLTDSMIANRLVADLEGLLVATHSAMLGGLRNDIVTLFYNFHGHMLVQSFTVKHMMEKRGWLRTPPPYHVAKASPTR